MGEINTVLSYKAGALARLGSPVRPPLVFGPSNHTRVLGRTLGQNSLHPNHAKGLIQLGLHCNSAPYPSTLLAGGISLLMSSTVGLCPPTKLLEASGPIPTP